MRRPSLVFGPLATALLLVVTVASPADAASGTLRISRGPMVVKKYDNPAAGCYEGIWPGVWVSDFLDNDTDSEVLVYRGDHCQGEPYDRLSAHGSKYVDHLGSVRVVH